MSASQANGAFAPGCFNWENTVEAFLVRESFLELPDDNKGDWTFAGSVTEILPSTLDWTPRKEIL